MSKAIESFKDMVRKTGNIPTLEEFMENTGYKRDSYFRAKRDYLENGLGRVIDVPPYNTQMWKTIPEFEDYLISNEAMVYNIKSNKILKPSLNRYGYYFMGLYKNGVLYSRLLHQLMGLAFIPNPENKPTIDHINRIRTDNRLENLRWATMTEQGENMTTNVKIIDEITGKKYQSLNSFKRENKGNIYIKCIENDTIYNSWESLTKDLFPNKEKKTVGAGVLRAINGNRKYCGYSFCKVHNFIKVKEG